MIIFLAQAVIGFNALNHMSRLSLTHTNTHARKVLPYMRYIGTCGKGMHGFSAILVIKTVWLSHSSLELKNVFLEEVTLSS